MSSSSYFSKLMAKYAKSTEEEKAVAAILFTDIDINMGDKRLNSLAALTYNAKTCENMFAMIEQALSPQENPWKTIYKALLLLHTIVLFGSELSIDKAISLCRFVNPLQQYNSALVKKGYFISTSGGMDYGAPVRATAKVVNDILITDGNIRQARAAAREGQNSLVPMGEGFEQHNPSAGMGPITFGQGLETSVGAGFGLQNVPGMYEGRPERYFDRSDDIRRPREIRDSQTTRDAQAPSLLDLVFDEAAPASSSGSNLPEAQFIPGLERQRELEQQLAAQTEQLRKLQELQAQQQALQQQQLLQQQQQQQQQFGMGQMQYQQQQQQPAYGQGYGVGGGYGQPLAPAAAPAAPSSSSLLDFGDVIPAAPAPAMGGGGMWGGAGSSQPQQQQPFGMGVGYQQQQQQPNNMSYVQSPRPQQQQYYPQAGGQFPPAQQQQQQQQQQAASNLFGGLGMMTPAPAAPPAGQFNGMNGGQNFNQQMMQQQQPQYPYQQQQQQQQQPQYQQGFQQQPYFGGPPPVPAAAAPMGPPPPVPSFAPPPVPGGRPPF